MQGRIDPPSSAGRLDAGAIRAQAETGEVWAIGAPPVGCVFLTPQAGGLYLGKLAVDPSQRRGGLGRRLLAQAETRARALGLARLDLKTRVELVENHAFFTAAGFRQVASQAHPGYARVTTLVFSKEVGA
ncbi:MAG TPA: GNAT family N-acetyltransferase [Aliiroseovarius sp.]|nr:GNAT family N-acetyltransferase [Aliiroseovarius sp.]